MKLMKIAAAAVLPLALSSLCHSQDLDAVNVLWKQTVTAVRHADNQAARASLARFTTTAASYVQTHGRSWEIEYLVGSVDCMFTDKRATGAEFLQDILANSRSLSEAGQAELRRQLDACNDSAQGSSTTLETATPPELADVSTHFQSVGIRGEMKGGGDVDDAQESVGAVSPIPEAELAARLVSVDQPDKALHDAMARLSPSARGAADGGFVVVSATGSEAQAKTTTACLARYAQPLKSEFQIHSSRYMVTAYSASYEDAVYKYAEKLHGLKLPFGVLAYSVPDDMSLVSAEFGQYCGSMAHELVHLLIKQNFHGAPAWLEEGLASEVAIATPTPQRFRFGWSWRDDRLLRDEENFPLSVQELLDMPWSALNAYDRSEIRRAEANQAMAAVFIRYLDARGKLPDIYFAVRDRHVNPDLSGFRTYREIVQEKLGMPSDAIEADFTAWFKSEAAAHRKNSTDYAPPMQGGNYLNVPNAARDTGCTRVYAQNAAQNAEPQCAPTTNAPPNAAAKPN
jgi:hypothetical protein